MAAEELQETATTSSWVRYMPFGGRQRERWWCRCCRVWCSRRPNATFELGTTGSTWFWREEDKLGLNWNRQKETNMEQGAVSFGVAFVKKFKYI